MGFTEVFVLLNVVISGCIYILSVKDLEWETMSIASIGDSNIVSKEIVLIFRLICAVLVLSLCAYLLLDRKGLTIQILGRNGKPKTIQLVGLERFTMFTVWCWTIQGYYFSLASICSIIDIWQISLVDVFGPTKGKFIEFLLTKCTWVLFEIGFSMAYLVTVVVTFVLIPGVKNRGMPTTTFFFIPALVMHNVNVMTMTGELLLSNMTFSLWHFPFALLFGCAYVIFQWIWVHRVDAFYYFFLDYDKPGAIFWYAGLILGVGLFFFLGMSAYVICGHHTFAGEIIIAILMLCTLQLRDTPTTKKGH